MNNPTLPVLRIHSMYDQGMQAVDIYEYFDCVHEYDAIVDCILDYTATGGDWDNSDDDVDEWEYEQSELDSEEC